MENGIGFTWKEYLEICLEIGFQQLEINVKKFRILLGKLVVCFYLGQYPQIAVTASEQLHALVPLMQNMCIFCLVNKIYL